ncbi:hypothetical protein WMY93_025677 [Mugilogobius chulae]|uniref:Pentraxin (PTX) domain-containing protein n=1 Tax=Mugilogobius chulae TaxID=88201 RepID=A0AAW0N017_9GOBI
MKHSTPLKTFFGPRCYLFCFTFRSPVQTTHQTSQRTHGLYALLCQLIQIPLVFQIQPIQEQGNIVKPKMRLPLAGGGKRGVQSYYTASEREFGFGHGSSNDHHHTLNSHHASGGSSRPYADKVHYSHHQKAHNGNYIPDSPLHATAGVLEKHVTPGDSSSSPEQSERMLQALKERLENLQKRNTSVTFSSSLKELLQRKISALEQQLHHQTGALSDHHYNDHHDDHKDDHHDDHQDDHHNDHNHEDHHSNDNNNDDHNHHDHNDDQHYNHDSHLDDHDDHHDDHDDHHEDHDDHHNDHNDHHNDHDYGRDGDHHDNEADNGFISHTSYRTPGRRSGFNANKLETMLNQLHLTGASRMKSPDAFLVSFPMRTNYMYGRVKKTLLQEIFAFTLCMWIKPGMGPGLGTPFSYSAPGQSNEIVLIEWGNNPIELLIDDKSVTLPLTLTDGKWHHVCVTWSTRDGHWEAYQDGAKRGSGANLSSWHPIKPGGIFILGQEQDTLGGRFDSTQSFVGEMSEVHLWSHVLSSSDIHNLFSCGGHLQGDVFAWTEAEVELHGGVTRHPYDPCH